MKMRAQLRFFSYRRRHMLMSRDYRKKPFTTQVKKVFLSINLPFICFSGTTEDELVDGLFYKNINLLSNWAEGICFWHVLYVQTLVRIH